MTYYLANASSLGSGGTASRGRTWDMGRHGTAALAGVPPCGVAVISNPTVCDICVFHAAVFSDIKIICDIGISFLTFLKHRIDLKLP